VTRLRDAFSLAGQGERHMWQILPVKHEYKCHPLFENYDCYGGMIEVMPHTLVMSPQEFEDQPISGVMLDHELDGHWIAQSRGWRHAGMEFRILFSEIEDADMLKLFGMFGRVIEYAIRR
jgi:hypothetical protein